MMCILASVAAKSGKGSDIVKQIPRVVSAPGARTRTSASPRRSGTSRAGKDINYEGVGGSADLDANGDLKTAIYNVFTYKDGKQTSCARSGSGNSPT